MTSNPTIYAYDLGSMYGDLCLRIMYGTLCLGAMYGDLCPRDVVWRPMTSRLCMETYVFGSMYGDLCLGAMYGDLCPRDYVWRPMSRNTSL